MPVARSSERFSLLWPQLHIRRSGVFVPIILGYSYKSTTPSSTKVWPAETTVQCVYKDGEVVLMAHRKRCSSKRNRISRALRLRLSPPPTGTGAETMPCRSHLGSTSKETSSQWIDLKWSKRPRFTASAEKRQHAKKKKTSLNRKTALCSLCLYFAWAALAATSSLKIHVSEQSSTPSSKSFLFFFGPWRRLALGVNLSEKVGANCSLCKEMQAFKRPNLLRQHSTRLG